VAAQKELREHPINAIGGLSPVFQKKQAPIETGFKGGTHKMNKGRKVAPHDDPRGCSRVKYFGFGRG
jgi:hypothetical protein